MTSQSSRSVLITGAGSGIGRASAEYFADRGDNLILMGRRAALLEEVRLSLKNPDRHLCLPCDLADSASIEAAVKILSESGIQVDVLINNAGIYEQNTGYKINTTLWQKMFQTNLFGAAELTERVLPLMPSHKNASILNVSSGLGSRPAAGVGIYSASKAAMESWTKSLAIELGSRGIRVNAIAPGLVDTPIHSFYNQDKNTKAETLKDMAGLQPLGRIGNSSEIAEAIYFLTSLSSKWTTGAVLTVDGGINLV